MEQVKNKGLFYFLLALVFLRPSLDVIGRSEFKIHRAIPSISLNIVLGGIVFLVAFFFIFKNLKSTISAPLFWPITVLLGFYFASIFYSIDPNASIRNFVQIASFLFLYFCAYLATDNEKDLITFLKVLILSYILPAIFAIFQFVLGKGLPDDWGGFLRIYGTFSHPNQFAFYTFFILSILLSLLLISFKKGNSQLDTELAKWQFLLYPAIFVSFSLLFLTYSRSALASLMIAVFIFGILKYKKLLLIGFLLFLVLFLFSEAFQERIWDLVSLDPYSSVVWRIKMWSDILPVAMWKPLLGHGLGTYPLIAEFYRGVIHGSLDPHNDFLKNFTENGVLGLFAYVWLVLTVLYYLFSSFWKSSDGMKTFALGLMVIQISLLATSFFDNILNATALQWNFWMLLGVWLKIRGK